VHGSVALGTSPFNTGAEATPPKIGEQGVTNILLRSPLEWQSCESFKSRNNALRSLWLRSGVARCKAGQQVVDEWVECRGMGMTRLIDRRRRLVLETPLLIGKRPLVVVVEPWRLPFVRRGVIRIFPSRGHRFGIGPRSLPLNGNEPRAAVLGRKQSLRKERICE